MLRPLLACFTASALLLVAACSTTTPEETPGDPATNEAETNTGKQNTSSGGSTSGGENTSSGGPTDPGTTSSGGPIDPGDGEQLEISTVSIKVQGQSRKYVLAVPKNYDANKAYPLIIGLHGDGGNADDFLHSSGLTKVVGDKAILAFPDQVLDLFTSYYDNNDQRLVAATIIQLKEKRNIDASKVWGYGYSKGAFMLNELGCRKPGLFSAIASHAGGAPQARTDEGYVNCPAAVDLPVFATMGTNDDIGGGKFQTDFWAYVNGCDYDFQSTDITNCQAYANCDTAVVFCQIPNQGHYPLHGSAASDTWKWFNSL